MSEVRLIDAVALRKAMYHEAMEKDSDEQKWESGCWIRYKMFERVLKTQPTIAPKRGKWMPEQPASSNGGTYAVIRYVICSECQFQMPLWEMNYCPNCGARMEGEE